VAVGLEEEKEATIKAKGNVRAWIAVTLFVVFFISYIDRTNVSVLIADNNFTDAFGVTGDKSSLGMIMTAFLLFYGMFSFFAGPFIERIGVRNSLWLGLLLWAVLMLIMGAVSSFAILIACRALLGAFESLVTPSVSKIIKTWFPVHERAKANAAWFNGLLAAQILSMPIVAALVARIGWRGCLVALALIGFIPLILVYYYVYDRLSQHPGITQEEIAYIEGGRKTEHNTADQGKIGFTFLKNSTFWQLVVMYCMINAAAWGMLAWLPTLLKETLGFSWANMGAASALPYIASFVGLSFLTPLIDKYNARSQFAFGSIVVFTVCFALTLVFPSSSAVVACISIAMAGIAVASVSSTNILQNTTAPNEVATAVGFYTGFAYIVSSFFPYAIGALYNMTGTLTTGFYMIITAGLIGISAAAPILRKRL
jgi:sugar phosphate permease